MNTPTESSLKDLAKRARDNAKFRCFFAPCFQADSTRFAVETRKSNFQRQGRAVMFGADRITVEASSTWRNLLHEASDLYADLAELAESNGIEIV